MLVKLLHMKIVKLWLENSNELQSVVLWQRVEFGLGIMILNKMVFIQVPLTKMSNLMLLLMKLLILLFG